MMPLKCEVCSIPNGETQCVTCGAEPPTVVGLVRELYEVGCLTPIPEFTMITDIREGVQIAPARCGKCGELTVSRIEGPDGKIGCLKCFGEFLKPKVPLRLD
jgi:hypothetical protein